jgi:hypothetical protein
MIFFRSRFDGKSRIFIKKKGLQNPKNDAKLEIRKLLHRKEQLRT